MEGTLREEKAHLALFQAALIKAFHSFTLALIVAKFGAMVTEERRNFCKGEKDERWSSSDLWPLFVGANAHITCQLIARKNIAVHQIINNVSSHYQK